MQLEVLENTENLSRLTLSGRLDAAGVGRIETRFTATTVARNRSALVDVSGVSFIASLGIGMLVTVARTLRRHGHRLILVAPQELVEEVLRAAAIDQLVGIAADEAEALAMLET
jgi:anti-sigma B factor antagonist